MDEQVFYYQVQVVGTQVVTSWIAVEIEQDDPDLAIQTALEIVAEYPDEIYWTPDSGVMDVTATLAVVDENGGNN